MWDYDFYVMTLLGFSKKIFFFIPAGPSEVAFGQGGSSFARSFPKPRSAGNQNLDPSAPKIQKEYVEPWDYTNSYYPTTHPLRRPYSGDPEILNEEEFGEASASLALDEAPLNAAEELGLMEKRDETQMLFFQFPANLPLLKRPAAATDNKDTVAKIDRASKKASKFEELQAGFMGKIMIYRSGKIKMKLGDAVYDISPGAKCSFAQEVVAINAKEKHCCILGEIDSRAVVTPDMDALLESIDNTDLL
ncbi:hypothetical protein Cni_G18922 [Canna indica]|uniref:DNA-directed RNA polymerase III subunit RPC4 n=1 Tax=Canna indica TaxID=4628 RepID=A0AAQ3QI68_9LILI|nr:hypothetical protein Cni_G18922 [Canna indica]